MQGASFDREIALGFARKAISQDGEAVRSDSSAVAVDDAQVARTTSAPVVLRVGFKAGKMTAGKHGEDPEVSEAVRRLQKSRLGYRFTKRAFDIVFSAFVLVSFSWLFVIVAIAIKIDDPKGPVFFKQKRVGKDGKEFNMYKFRSMCVDAEEKLAELRELNEKTGPVFKIAEDPRITRVGKWLRKLSLDELPQFINVLRSDIPLRILKTRPEFSEKSMGAFALPAKSSTNKGKAFSQVVSCFANGLRMRRISKFNCNRIRGMEAQFLAKPVFGAVCA
jgi:lipopolysaccharide/colanic/teichoic acid biosynthesis glycosyltransferase